MRHLVGFRRPFCLPHPKQSDEFEGRGDLYCKTYQGPCGQSSDGGGHHSLRDTLHAHCPGTDVHSESCPLSKHNHATAQDFQAFRVPCPSLQCPRCFAAATSQHRGKKEAIHAHLNTIIFILLLLGAAMLDEGGGGGRRAVTGRGRGREREGGGGGGEVGKSGHGGGGGGGREDRDGRGGYGEVGHGAGGSQDEEAEENAHEGQQSGGGGGGPGVVVVVRLCECELRKGQS